jgi:hypothetical protein
VHAPTPMIREPFFSIRVVAPTVHDTVASTPIFSSLMATMNENKEPVIQDPIVGV